MSRFQPTQPSIYSGFNPLTIGICSLWLDAADPATITLSGSNVSKWADKSGSNLDASGTVLPTYSNNAIIFDGSSQYLTTKYTASTQNETVFIVSYLDTSSYANSPTMLSGSANGGRQLQINTSGALQANVQNVTSGPTGGTAPTSQLAIYTYTSSNAGTSNSIRFWINGSNVNTGTNLGVFSNNLTSWIGAWPGGNYWQGRICEIITYPLQIPFIQREQVEKYLASKWNISILESYTTKYVHQFLPTDLTECGLWLDAMDSNSIVFSGSNIVTWKDKSGTGTDASASVTTAPTWSNNQVVINGYSNWMTCDATIPTTRHAIFVVHNPGSDVSMNTRLVSFQGVGGTGAIVFPYAASSTTPRGYINTNASQIGAGASLLKDYSISGQLNLVSANITPGSQIVYKSGVAMSTCNQGTIISGTSPTLYIGNGRPGYPKEVYIGSVGEILVYKRLLLDYERRQVEGYLARKWGIASSLPGKSTTTSLPTSFPGCVMWLDGADINTITLSGSVVTRWADKSGYGNDASGGVPPTYVSSAVNGLGALSFNGSNTYLNSVDLYSGYRPFMVNMVFRRNANITAQSGLISSQVYATGSNMHLTFPTNATTFRFGAYGSDLTYSSFPAYSSPDPPYLVSAVMNPYNRRLYVNGVFATGDSGVAGINAHPNGVIGKYGTSYFNGYICEVLVYNSTPVTDIVRQQVEAYLVNKWNISGFPATHPFRTAVTPATISFNPRAVSNCIFWLDAADYQTFTSNENSIVTSVIDKSSNGYIISNTMTTNGFTWNQTKFNSSYPSFYYSNGTQNVTLGSNSNTIIAGSTSIFAVYHRLGSGTNQFIFDVCGGTTKLRMYYTTSSTAGIRFDAGVNSRINNPVGPAIQTVVHSNIAADFYLNGSTAIYSNTGSFNAPYGISVGAVHTQTTQSFQGHIAELIFYSRNLTVAELRKIEGYLAWKWGLQSNLPSTHPYKNIRVY